MDKKRLELTYLQRSDEITSTFQNAPASTGSRLSDEHQHSELVSSCNTNVCICNLMPKKTLMASSVKLPYILMSITAVINYTQINANNVTVAYITGPRNEVRISQCGVE